jgi:trehalose 6-phosphate phosphatase
VAVVSGRPIEQIDAFLQPLRLPVAGVHGAERRRADGSMALAQVLPLEPVEEAAQALARRHPGLQVEKKRGSIALHYRLAPELESLCQATMQRAVEAVPGLSLLHGKMVIEAKPGGASKGHAIEAFLREPPFAGRTPVFIGDDVTDESVFAVMPELGGINFSVSREFPGVSHVFSAPADVRRALAQIAASHR